MATNRLWHSKVKVVRTITIIIEKTPNRKKDIDVLSLKKPKKTLEVLVDSNFFFIPSKFKVDIFEELAKILNRRFELIILSSTHKELSKMAKDKAPKFQRQATFALKLAQKCQQLHVEKKDEESPDDMIVRVASRMNCCVATNDRALKKRLRHLNVSVIYLRQKSHLAIDGAP